MSRNFVRRSVGGQATSRQTSAYLIDMGAARRAERSCCCSAKPGVVAVMPPSADRRHQTDLLLCGHHYRASKRALAVAGAVVTEIGEPWPMDGDHPLVLSAG
jgi:hypothetical protein